MFIPEAAFEASGLEGFAPPPIGMVTADLHKNGQGAVSMSPYLSYCLVRALQYSYRELLEIALNSLRGHI